MHVQVPAASANLTANGDTDGPGYVRVADNSPFYAGAVGWLADSDGSQRILITELSGSTIVGVRFIAEENQGFVPPAPNYGRSSTSAFTTAKSARLYMSAQVVNVEASFVKPTKPSI